MPPVEPNLHMWLTLVLTGVAVIAFAIELLPVELIALGILGGLLLLFELAPLVDATGTSVIGPQDLLQGFASPALIAVSALLVIGQAMVSTGALESVARGLLWIARGSFGRALSYSLVGVGGASGFLNNTPLVVIFMPILRSIAERYGHAPSQVMMPLSFAAILGGMLTLIGTSTNILVSGELTRLGVQPFRFFDLTVAGLVLAGAGMTYVLILPWLLPRRQDPAILHGSEGRQFIAEVDIVTESPLVGESARGGMFPSLAEVTVRLVQRGERAILPPFEDLTLEPGDILIVAATRRVLTEMLTTYHGHLLDPPVGERLARSREQREMVLAEAMVRPASRIIGQTLELTNFPARSHCTVLGIQRRARMLRTRLGELRLAPGDVLLLLGFSDQIERLRADPDVLLMEWSASEMPVFRRAPVAAAILAGVILPAALDLVPIVVTALLGVLALVATGCLNVRQAARAVDRQIVLVIASALGLGVALEATGAAAYLAGLVVDALAGAPPAVILSALFLLVAILTNVLTNNATAVLFTPVAINLAHQLQADVFPFALAVAFGASCSFATPIGYQTNLLVMGPGQYRFKDFVIAGLPLVVIVWLAFSMFVPWYYGV
jgi:di/tricarboxylate transporter